MFNQIIRSLKRLFNKQSEEQKTIRTVQSIKSPSIVPVEFTQKTQLLTEQELRQSESLFYDLMFGKIKLGDSSDVLENKILDKLRDTLQDVDSITKNITQLPSIILQVDRELNSPNCDASKIAQLIQRDPVIAAKVLKLINSPLYKPQGKDITDLQQSITYLGEKVIHQLLFTVVMENMADTPKIYFRLFGEQIWKHSLQTAKIATQLAKLMNESSSTAYLIGLVHDIGKIAIFKILVQELRTSHPDFSVCSSLFRQALTDNSNSLSFKIAESWKLPEEVSNALNNQLKQSTANTNPLSKILYQANLYSELFMLLEGGLIDKEFSRRLCVSRQLDPSYLDSMKLSE